MVKGVITQCRRALEDGRTNYLFAKLVTPLAQHQQTKDKR